VSVSVRRLRLGSLSLLVVGALGPAGATAPPWPALVGISALLAGLSIYWWTTMRRWCKELRALEGARTAAERLATAGRVSPATVATAQRQLAVGERPGVRSRLIDGYAVPWFQDSSFQPAWDFDPRDGAPAVPWHELPAPDRLFTPLPRVVAYTDDPRWAALQPPR
jgi:hypothetical protein